MYYIILYVNIIERYQLLYDYDVIWRFTWREAYQLKLGSVFEFLSSFKLSSRQQILSK